MRLLDAVARAVLAITLAALVVGHGFIMPLLIADHPLLDANLARAVASPIELRIADVVVFGCLLTACVVPRWSDRHVSTTLALLATVLAGCDRLLLLPRLHAAWSQVDLVAGRPLDRLAEAQQLAHQHLWVAGGIGVCLLAVSILTEYARPLAGAGRRVAPAPVAPAVDSTAAPSAAPVGSGTSALEGFSQVGGSAPARA